jgi:hypothetical protein
LNIRSANPYWQVEQDLELSCDQMVHPYGRTVSCRLQDSHYVALDFADTVDELVAVLEPTEDPAVLRVQPEETGVLVVAPRAVVEAQHGVVAVFVVRHGVAVFVAQPVVSKARRAVAA